MAESESDLLVDVNKGAFTDFSLGMFRRLKPKQCECASKPMGEMSKDFEQKTCSWRDPERRGSHLNALETSRNNDMESVEAAFEQESCIEAMPVRDDGGFRVSRGCGREPAEPAAVSYSTAAISQCIPL